MGRALGVPRFPDFGSPPTLVGLSADDAAMRRNGAEFALRPGRRCGPSYRRLRFNSPSGGPGRTPLACGRARAERCRATEGCRL